MTEYNTSVAQQDQSGDTLQIKDLISLCIAKWYWFVIAVVFCLGIAFLYLRRTVPTYERTAQVLIKSETQGASAADYDFSNLGLVSSNAKVTNEVSTFGTTANMLEVVHRLSLETACTVDGPGHRVLLYAQTQPVRVSIDSLGDLQTASFTVKTDGVSKITLKEFVLGEEKFKGQSVTGRLGERLETPIGPVCIEASSAYKGELPETFYVSRSSLHGTTTRFSKQLTIANDVKNRSDVITLTIQDINIQRAEDILNTLIAVYNENWIKDKNQLANSTSMFIDDRLSVIERELADVDSDISSYKSEQLVPDVGAAAAMYMNQNTALDAQQQALTNQLSMARYIRNYIASDNDPSKLIPANSGVDNPGLESQIAAYNTKVLERNSLVANSSTVNPLVIDADEVLSDLRANILSTVDNAVVALEAQIGNLQRSERRNTSRIAANPTQAKHLLGVERQQAVKEALYLFLLQKREENELSQAFTAYNTRVIDPPTGSMKPVAPSRSKIMLLALLLGLFLPLALIYLMQSLNTTVRGRQDLKRVSIPFLGEIPYNGEKQHLLRPRLQAFLGKKQEDAHPVVVEKGNRDIINEAFRVLRTNVEFMTQESGPCVIAITSFNPGSGKSFLSMNLAVSLAIKDKKVLVVDGDLRHASQSQYIENRKIGFADYLAHRTDDLRALVSQSPNHPTLYGLPVGTIPPNPTELISDKRFAAAIEELKADYDFVIIDCPPIEIVADTQIIERSCDRTFFVIRAGLLERAMLPELEAIYKEGKFKNMAMILNGSTQAGSGHYGYRYGYRYGYHSYGYHSYGYYGDKESQKGKSKRV
ncbi:MAG: polysaccharide biosynthesis tyrosine autokinase [Bacteroidales bacterium]|nr:polysaccharide biosynthesis tyrosine autokinase [Bacteroidales bacterium]